VLLEYTDGSSNVDMVDISHVDVTSTVMPSSESGGGAVRYCVNGAMVEISSGTVVALCVTSSSRRNRERSVENAWSTSSAPQHYLGSRKLE
jgi:hypothetical protein